MAKTDFRNTNVISSRNNWYNWYNRYKHNRRGRPREGGEYYHQTVCVSII